MSRAGQTALPSPLARPIQSWARAVSQFLAHGLWNTTVVGRGHIPTTGPVIIAANHIGLIEAPILVGAHARGTHFLTKYELFHSPLAPILRSSGQIPINRDRPRRGLKTALAVLANNDVVGIFPEGARGSGDMSNARSGVTWLAVTASAPIVPTAVLGTRRTGQNPNMPPALRSPIFIAFGEPLYPNFELGSRRETTVDLGVRYQDAMQTLLRDAAAASGLSLPADDPYAAYSQQQKARRLSDVR